MTYYKKMANKLTLSDFGQMGDCVCGDEHDERAQLWFKEVSVKEFISMAKSKIISEQGASDYILNGNRAVEIIDELAGDALVSGDEQNA